MLQLAQQFGFAVVDNDPLIDLPDVAGVRLGQLDQFGSVIQIGSCSKLLPPAIDEVDFLRRGAAHGIFFAPGRVFRVNDKDPAPPGDADQHHPVGKPALLRVPAEGAEGAGLVNGGMHDLFLGRSCGLHRLRRPCQGG